MNNVTLEDEDGCEIELPMKWEICGTCHGNCKHSLAVDGEGITQEDRERDWSDEEWEQYMAGGYDQPCENCGATGKVKVVDESVLSDKERKLYDDWCKSESEYKSICRMERLYGC